MTAVASSSSSSLAPPPPPPHSPMLPRLHGAFRLRLHLPPRHPLIQLLHSSSPGAHPPPPHAAELWIAKALVAAAFLRPHHLPAFRGLALSHLAAAAALRLAPCASSALRLFDALHSPPLSVPPSEHSYRHVVALLCRSGHHGNALKLFDQMTDQSGCFPDEGFLSFVVGSCTTAGLLDAAAALLSKGSQFGCCIEPYAYNRLMNSFIGHGRAHDAVALFERWVQEGLYTPDVWSFNVVIKGVCRVGDVQKALQLVERMDEFGCSPDTVTHNILVDGLCRVKEVNKGCEVLRRLQKDGVCMPNVVTYTSVISGYCKAGRMEDAMAVYNDMVGSGTAPNAVTYNVLINGYGKAGDMGSAVGVYQQMMLRRCPPDVVTFSSLIDGYCRCGQLDGAMRIWKEMARYHIQPNVYTFSIIIHSLCKQNKSEEALDLLRELNMRADIAPQAFIYNPVIDILCKGGKVDEANLILMDMEEKRCRPDKYTYTILIIGYCMKGRIPEAIALFHKMVENGCYPDNITVNSFISCLLKAGMPSEVDHIMLIASGRAKSSHKVSSPLSQGLDISVAV
ncbi:LOW QUALITY PROTEIN: pentatricopeptide repeat-containing protein At2g06000-like [Phragmites australis]|uniref:LOW QUALITY PROTEIN: pentatricopeptide repeat-containing protein At2g06000-like n=1 Tax=Phragmites australis TaxID=29695 RepID=UPI002D7652DD|nr:LOW QUALITY PROTEIN: pentatricopeptide repeat-containing protein At2g06000-like [Phragmites australis]